MGTSQKLVGSVLLAVLSALVLIATGDAAVDVPDGVVLFASVAILSRTALRGASDTAPRRHPRQ